MINSDFLSNAKCNPGEKNEKNEKNEKSIGDCYFLYWNKRFDLITKAMIMKKIFFENRFCGSLI
jgi:hypothetical protein